MIRKTFICFILSIFLCNNLIAQIIESGILFDEISTIISGMPGDTGDDYADPTTGELNTWGEILNHLLNGEYADAASDATSIDYDLIEFTDTGSGVLYYILKSNNTNYWGSYVYNPNYCRSLVVQSPHPKKDFNTGKEGIHVFEESEALFFCLAGTNRCNQSAYSSCSGTTSICGTSESYRISDLAHSTSTVFQNTTDTLLNRFSDTYFISLHGFTKLATDPYVILSNGTRITPTPDFIDTLDDKLLAEDAMLTFKIAHIDLSWNRLIGFTNTQGRLINASSDHCTSSATTTNGRFIHMEQEKTRLRDDITGWTKVSNAVKNTFPCVALPLSFVRFRAFVKNEKTVQCSWTTANEWNNQFFEVERSMDGLDWKKIGTVDENGSATSETNYSFLDEAPVGFAYYRIRQVDVNGLYTFSSINFVKLEKKENKLRVYPNPTRTVLDVEGEIPKVGNIRIFNLLGQDFSDAITIEKKSDQRIQLDVSNCPFGMYMINWEGGSYLFLKN